MAQNIIHQSSLSSPIGTLRLYASQKHLIAILFDGEEETFPADSEDSPVLHETARQLQQYFAGSRKTFDLPLAPSGTGFQQQVWKALLDIPYGQTTTYKNLAEAIHNPKAVRAVGSANGSNPIPIIIPCHRVIGSDNNLIGYGGGIERKRWLLQHEGAILF